MDEIAAYEARLTQALGVFGEFTMKLSLLLVVLIVISACKPHSSQTKLSLTTTPAEIAGTGLRLTLPDNLDRFPLGTFFTNEDASTTITIISGVAKYGLEDDKNYRMLFPHDPRKLVAQM